MNILATLMSGEPSSFEVALDRRNGPAGRDALIHRLKTAEATAAELCQHAESAQERALIQRYVDAITCARAELERIDAVAW
ncbi:hypothetical protein [Burkholderia territorii]|uniref:hypothetical protein n=1 Tax=Burkholderia territorii TaxID=1503055 RepID=UPI0009C0378F|nr:hypothetical protein [Burkholderia territorii]